MKSSRQLAAVIATACVLSLTLSGCSLVSDAGQVWGILESDLAQQRALTLAVTQLERIEGVESASFRFTADTPEGDVAELHIIVAADMTHDQAWKVATATRENFTSAELETAVPLFTLRTAGEDSGVLSRSYFGYSDEQFADDFAYWRDAEAAIGANLSLALTSRNSNGLYDRTFTSPKGADSLATTDRVIKNFAALAAVHDETKSPTTWEFAGIRSYPDLPPAEAVELLDDIRGTIALLDYSALPENPGPGVESPEGVQLQRNKPFGDEQSAAAEVVILQREYRETDWKKVVAAGAIVSGVPELNLVYSAGDEQFLLHTSDCEGTIYESSGAQKLFDAILASGAEFLPGAGPGLCIPER